jgi:hypothetical protein
MIFPTNIGFQPTADLETSVVVTPHQCQAFRVTADTLEFPVTVGGKDKFITAHGSFLYTLSSKILSGDLNEFRIGPVPSLFGASITSITTEDKVTVPSRPLAPETTTLPPHVWCISDGTSRWYLSNEALEYFAQQKPGQGNQLLLQFQNEHCFKIKPLKTATYDTFREMRGPPILDRNRLVAGHEFVLPSGDDSYRAEEITFDCKYSYATKSNWQILVNNSNRSLTPKRQGMDIN